MNAKMQKYDINHQDMLALVSNGQITEYVAVEKAPNELTKTDYAHLKLLHHRAFISSIPDGMQIFNSKMTKFAHSRWQVQNQNNIFFETIRKDLSSVMRK